MYLHQIIQPYQKKCNVINFTLISVINIPKLKGIYKV